MRGVGRQRVGCLVAGLLVASLVGSAALAAPTTGSIGDLVWYDLDADGVVDGGEPGVAGVSVQLLDSRAKLLATKVTDSNGIYLFAGLTKGTYTVEVVAASVPAGAIVSGSGSLPVSLASGQNFATADFALLPVRVSGSVFEDVNGNGTMDGTESGFASVSVQAMNGSNVVVAAATTTSAGSYVLYGMSPGVLSVVVDVSSLPVGTTLTTANVPWSVSVSAGGVYPPDEVFKTIGRY